MRAPRMSDPPPSLTTRRRGLWLLAGGLGAAATRVRLARAEGPARPFRIVVNPGNQVSSLDRRFLSQAFLKKITSWDGGDPIRPVDLPANAEARRHFSEAIHGRSVSAVKSYWQQMIFSGRGVPPPELEGDEAVIRHVTRHPGGIGYVSPSADLQGAKVIQLR